MSTTLIRVFETAQPATDAVAALKKKKYLAQDIDLFVKETPDAQAALVKAGVPAKTAEKLVAELAKGHAVVVTRPPYANTVKMTNILEEFKPLEVKFETEIMEKSSGFISEVLGIPLLIKSDSPTQLLKGGTISEAFGIPTTINVKPMAGLFHRTIGSKLGLPEIIKK